MRLPSPSRWSRLLAPLWLLLAGASAGCGKDTQVEPGALLLELSVADGLTTPDELRVSVYDDAGSLWTDARIPGAGALVPESATRLGTVLIQPGTTQGGLRVHVRGFAASARVADGTLTIPASARGRFALRLDGELPADGDGDGVPDAIDDCPAVSDRNQGGCTGTADGGDGGNGDGDAARGDGASGDGEPGDGGGMDAINCDASGACSRVLGAACADGAQCASSFCVDGVCCANACVGPCRSCNQPGHDGTCQPYAQATDPAGECTSGATCNGAGACGPPPGGLKANGATCGGGNECTSTFCKDGVCCNNACDGTCRTCATGTCADVKRRTDPPECEGTMTCNANAKCVVM
jgi:hypothetical protein